MIKSLNTDTAAEQGPSLASMSYTSARALSIAKCAPQSLLFLPRLDVWMSNLLRTDEPNAAWHAMRLHGLYGDDMARITQAISCTAGRESRANLVVREKLLLTTPEAVSRREADLDPILRMGVRRCLAASACEEEISKISRGQGAAAWMRYAAADVVMSGGKSCLIEYRVFDRVLDEGELQEAVCSSMHLGRMVAQALGIHIDTMLVAQWDLRKWRPVIHEIPFAEVVESLVLAAGDWVWNEHVLRGEELASLSSSAGLVHAGMSWQALRRGVPPGGLCLPSANLGQVRGGLGYSCAACA